MDDLVIDLAFVGAATIYESEKVFRSTSALVLKAVVVEALADLHIGRIGDETFRRESRGGGGGVGEHSRGVSLLGGCAFKGQGLGASGALRRLDAACRYEDDEQQQRQPLQEQPLGFSRKAAHGLGKRMPRTDIPARARFRLLWPEASATLCRRAKPLPRGCR